MSLVLRQITLGIIFLASLTACKKEDPSPELKDPIYKDLKARAESYEKSVEEGKIKVKDLRLSVTKAEANTIDKKNIQKDLAKAEKKLVGDEQLFKYYKIRTERRRVTGRLAYRKAFSEGKDWPNHSEYSDYQLNMRLHEISLNWNTRVPKLQDRIEKRAPAKAEKKQSEAEKE